MVYRPRQCSECVTKGTICCITILHCGNVTASTYPHYVEPNGQGPWPLFRATWLKFRAERILKTFVRVEMPIKESMSVNKGNIEQGIKIRELQLQVKERRERVKSGKRVSQYWGKQLHNPNKD